MKFPWQRTTWENSIKSNVALSISNAVLALATFTAVIHSYGVKDTVVLVPPVVDEKMTVGWNSANEAYIKSFSIYATTLIANITQTNVNFVVDALSQFMDTGVYTETRQTILAAAQSRLFKEAAGASKYVAKDAFYEKDTNKVFVIGEMTILNAANNPTQHAMIYEITIKIVDRRPVIFALDSYDGSEMHTVQWVKDHTSKDKK